MNDLVGSVATIALALLLAGGMALAVGNETAKAAFPGTNGPIVFVEENYLEPEDNGIRLINPDGSGARTLVDVTLSSVYDIGPTLSPSGRRVAYAGGPPGTQEGFDAEIFTIDVATRRITRITDNDQADRTPTWKPDGTRIAFSHDRVLPGGKKDSDIYVKRSDGTGATVNKTLNPNANDLDPTWSPDGKELAYAEGGRIAALDLETGEKRVLAGGDAPGYAYSPSWSPDGRRIAYASSTQDPQSEYNTIHSIYAMNASDGSDRRLLAQGVVFDAYSGTSVRTPAYSPDGKQIVYARYPQDYVYTRPQLFTMNATDGSDKKLLYNAYFSRGGYPYTEEVWLSSPDWGRQPTR